MNHTLANCRFSIYKPQACSHHIMPSIYSMNLICYITGHIIWWWWWERALFVYFVFVIIYISFGSHSKNTRKHYLLHTHTRCQFTQSIFGIFQTADPPQFTHFDLWIWRRYAQAQRLSELLQTQLQCNHPGPKIFERTKQKTNQTRRSRPGFPSRKFPFRMSKFCVNSEPTFLFGSFENRNGSKIISILNAAQQLLQAFILTKRIEMILQQ